MEWAWHIHHLLGGPLLLQFGGPLLHSYDVGFVHDDMFCAWIVLVLLEEERGRDAAGS